MVDDQIPQYAELLKHLFLFQDLDTAQIAHLVARFQPATYDKDQVVFAEDSDGDRFYIVFSGRVKVSRMESDGVRRLGILGKGEYFGEEALLFDRPRSATVTAIEPTTLLYLEGNLFEEMLRDFPLIQRILSVTADSHQMAYRQAQARDIFADFSATADFHSPHIHPCFGNRPFFIVDFDDL
jgi:CRP-like cAMP-binding protein